MDGLISLSLDLQIILVAGFLGYKISTIGRGLKPSTEEFLFLVLAYGSAGRAFAWLVEAIARAFPLAVSSLASHEGKAIASAGLTLLVGAVAGLIWRKWGNSLASRLMRVIGAYADDHEGSAWTSILNTKAKWNFIHAYTKDGRVLESWFGGLPGDLPAGSLTLNDDGLAFYVTRIYSADNAAQDVSHRNGEDYVLTYLPRGEIVRLDIGWR